MDKVVASVEDIEDAMLTPADFHLVLEKHFGTIQRDGELRTIIDKDFRIEFFMDTAKKGIQMLTLYGERGLYELVSVARENGWQIFDTFLGTMIQVDHPETNGYNNFLNYLKETSAHT